MCLCLHEHVQRSVPSFSSFPCLPRCSWARDKSVNNTTKAGSHFIGDSGNWLDCAGSPKNCCVTSVSAFAACSLVFGCVDSGLRGVHNLVKGYPCPARDLLPRKINSGCPACLQQLTSVDSFRRHDLLTLCLRTDVFTSLGFSFLICKTG